MSIEILFIQVFYIIDIQNIQNNYKSKTIQPEIWCTKIIINFIKIILIFLLFEEYDNPNLYSEEQNELEIPDSKR